MNKIFLALSGLSGAVVVILGAIGAHSLEEKIDPGQLHSFETGVKYQFWHTIALLAIALMAGKHKVLKAAGWCFVIGILLFAGSLYLLSTKTLHNFDTAWAGPVTPVGGLFFVAGWMLVLSSAFVKEKA